jgi:putative transposase
MGNNYQEELRPQRKDLRLNGRDYSAPGYYFITICTLRKTEWLGDIVNDEICLSSAGKILQSVWKSLLWRFPGLLLDSFVVMPNHVHGIILLTEHLRYSKPGLMLKPTLNNIVSAYKGAATYLIQRVGGIPEFAWHKSYYDVIMRNNRALDRTRRYIAQNPERWIADRFYIRDTMMGNVGNVGDTGHTGSTGLWGNAGL